MSWIDQYYKNAVKKMSEVNKKIKRMDLMHVQLIKFSVFLIKLILIAIGLLFA